MIVCQICTKRPATTHLTEIDPATAQRREVHLCGSCIETLDLKLEAGPPPVATILAKKPVGKEAKEANEDTIVIDVNVSAEGEAEKCDACGLTFAEFAVNNRFGCPRCYAGFGAKVETLLARYHGSSMHVGRTPANRPASDEDLRARRARLDAALQEAVAHEAYEKAAAIRDEIRRLEAERQRK
jgi:protein arginine kinase activator